MVLLIAMANFLFYPANLAFKILYLATRITKIVPLHFYFLLQRFNLTDVLLLKVALTLQLVFEVRNLRLESFDAKQDLLTVFNAHGFPLVSLVSQCQK